MPTYGYKNREDIVTSIEMAAKYRVTPTQLNAFNGADPRGLNCRHYVGKVTVSPTDPDTSDPNNPVAGVGTMEVYVFTSKGALERTGSTVDFFTLGDKPATDTLITIHQDAAGRFWLGGGGGAAHVATVTSTIPARSGDTPGGPVTATIRNSSGGGDFVDGGTVDVYSWVQSPSANPADQPGGVLYIFISQGVDGTWWFIAQDCTEPATAINEVLATADLVVTTTLQQVPGTTLTLPTFEGVYLYNIDAELSVTGIPGNQSWDVDIGIYNVTDAALIKAWSWAGQGDIPHNPTLSVSWSFDNDITLAGKDIAIAAVRATTTGTVTILYQDINLNPATFHAVTGPV